MQKTSFFILFLSLLNNLIMAPPPKQAPKPAPKAASKATPKAALKPDFRKDPKTAHLFRGYPEETKKHADKKRAEAQQLRDDAAKTTNSEEKNKLNKQAEEAEALSKALEATAQQKRRIRRGVQAGLAVGGIATAVGGAVAADNIKEIISPDDGNLKQ